ncbi:MAG: YiaA/YiaB family inner membrane protein [Candidatus Nanopelagicales bacterium]
MNTTRADYPAPTVPAVPVSVPPPSGAWQGVSWFAFALGAITFLYAAWYAPLITVGERYFLYTAALFSLYGCLGVAKVVRDRQEGIPVTALFYGLSYVAALAPFILVSYNLVFDSVLPLSSRTILGLSFALTAYATLAIAKNERDKACLRPTGFSTPKR